MSLTFTLIQRTVLDQYIYLNGVYEDHILDRILKYLPSEGVFMDIGSNIGLHSLFAACFLHQRGGKGKVYAFEPVPRLRDQLSRSVALNGFDNVIILEFACGNEKKTSTIFHNLGNMGASSLTTALEGSVGTSVQIKRLDDQFGARTRVDLIKIDVEGYEPQVLDGAKELIEAQKPVLIIEFSPITSDRQHLQKSHAALLYLLSIYNVFDVKDGDSPVLDADAYLSTFDHSGRKQANLLCLPK